MPFIPQPQDHSQEHPFRVDTSGATETYIAALENKLRRWKKIALCVITLVAITSVVHTASTLTHGHIMARLVSCDWTLLRKILPGPADGYCELEAIRRDRGPNYGRIYGVFPSVPDNPEYWLTSEDTPCHDRHNIEWVHEAELTRYFHAYGDIATHEHDLNAMVVSRDYRGHGCVLLVNLANHDACNGACAYEPTQYP